ncbi:uncharacterized protein PpBr36_09902 [Pyricularia pennisetigena]|uniref:uncharacterized protein n=1 Tax=Pyricularia pennisetigena TaxID=1578925 RepID=UPI001150943E|nr:uncharacterized protein PpBr36_09902 [Pyricularia pennisetigena]TLS22168.1 hypothetical protein PpBr36_09902 [Pyricularia pennisetigena]
MQITTIATVLSLVLPSVLAGGQAGGHLERRASGGLVSALTITVRDADVSTLAERSPVKNNRERSGRKNNAKATNGKAATAKANEPLIKANPGQSQAEQDKITAQLDAENNPQPPARAAEILGGRRGS